MPANGESICIECAPHIPIDIAVDLLKRVEPIPEGSEPRPKRARRLHGTLVYSDDVRTSMQTTTTL